MAEPVTPKVAEFWRTFCAAHDVDPGRRCDVFRFGDSDAMADELAELVRTGPKRATCGLAMDFGAGREPLPAVGEYSVVLDGAGHPRCVIRTTEVEVKPLDQVDAVFAWDEGEGDRTLDWWAAGHQAYFTRDLARQGLEFRTDLPTVFERFELVWAP